jgi:hypothetical protein
MKYYCPYPANDNKHKYYIITKNEKKIYNTNIYDNNISNISMLIQSSQPIRYNLEFQ